MSKQQNKNQNKSQNENSSGQVFYQKNQATGEVREFEIFNEKYLKVTTQRLMQESSFQFNVGLLEPWPSRHRQISWFWLSASGYFAIATIAYISYLVSHFMASASSQLLSQLLPLVVIFILLTLAALVLFFLKSPNVMQFRSRYGGCVLVSVFYNRPDAKKFEQFVEQLKNKILATSQNMNMDKRRMLLIEMQELKRLGNEGILSPTDIKQAQMRFAQLNFA